MDTKLYIEKERYMDRWLVAGQIDKINRQINKQINEQIDKQIVRQIEKINRFMNNILKVLCADSDK